jgi:hypothetical protein
LLRIVALCLALLAAAPAQAQGWTVGAFDNGAWFEAWALSPDGRLQLYCGDIAPAGLPLPQTDEPMTTAPYVFHLVIDTAEPIQGHAPPPRADLVVVAGAQGFRLPRAEYDHLNNAGRLQPLSFGDPLLQALRSAPAVAVDSAGGRLIVQPGDGLGAAIDIAASYFSQYSHLQRQ